MSSTQQVAAGRIVVGVDGSPSSRAALAWAVRQAGLTGVSVDAVIAWHYPVAVGGVPLAPIGTMADDVDFGGLAAQVLSEALTATVDPDGPVKVSSTVREGTAASVLLEAASGADLLVVGSRGHSGFTEALLGSASRQCVHHARCPVAVIRAPSAG